MAGPNLLTRAVLFSLITIAALAPVRVLAHPLGNFTVNRYSRLEPERGVIRVRHVLDVAEIPAIQEQQRADTNLDGAVSEAEWGGYKTRKVEELRQGLELTVDGQRVQLETEQSGVSTPPGQAGLSLIRVEAWFRAGVFAGEYRVTFHDRNEPTRIG
jgi:nickel/cobalt exporter